MLCIEAESLQVWIKKGIRGVWFEVEPAFSEWIPVLIQVQFVKKSCVKLFI